MPDGGVEVAVCDHCVAEEPQPEHGQWATEIGTIREILGSWAVAENIEQKADLLRTLLTACSGYEAFLAVHPTFRKAMAAKVEEARVDPVFGPLVPELLDTMEHIFAALPERDDFIE